MSAVRVVETFVHFTPLGIRFWDVASEVPILERLDVRAWRADADYPAVPAVLGASGIYSFHDLPGLRGVEFPTGAGPSSPPPATTFIVTVVDPQPRFLPIAFGVDLPLPPRARGLFPPPSTGSVPRPGGRAFLFSAPARPVVPGLVAIRADLWDSATDAPASWAVLDVDAAGSRHIGMADARGSALVLFPLPSIESLASGSPPGSGQVPLTDVTWPVTARVRYQPARVRFPLAQRAAAPWRDVPSLRSVIEEQGLGQVEPVAGSPAAEITTQMRFGETLVLRTSFPGPQQPTRLLVRRSP